MSDAPQGPGWWQASDGKYYPPQPAASPPPAVAEKKGMPGCLKWGLIAAVLIIVLGGGCIALIGGAANEASKDIDKENADSLDDAKVTKCGVNESLNFMTATVTVTNDSSKRSNYLVDVVFENADGDQLDSSSALINSVEPAQTATGEAVTATEPTGKFTCRVSDVERLSDEG